MEERNFTFHDEGIMDFTGLTDEQLLELITAAMAEARVRGVANIASAIYLDEQQKAQIEAEVKLRAAAAALEKERAKVEAAAAAKVAQENVKQTIAKNEATWAKKAAAMLALKADPLFAEDKNFSLNIWTKGDMKRVYLQEFGAGRNGWEIIYHVTGNQSHPPGSITGVDDEDVFRMKAFFKELLTKWNSVEVNYQ